MTRLESAVWNSQELPALLAAFVPGCAAIHPSTGADLRRWMENSAARIGLDAGPVDLWGFQVAEQLRVCAPAIVETPLGWLGVADCRGSALILISPSLRRVRVKLEDVRAAICSGAEADRREANLPLVEACGLRGVRREAALRALCREQSRYAAAGTLYRLRTPAGAPVKAQAAQAGIPGLAALLAFAHLGEYALALAAWWMLGAQVLQGRLDRGWLLGWALMLAGVVPFRMLTVWCQGKLAISVGGLLKQRLLAGALKLEPDEVRRQGAGQFLARCIESEMVETLALSGGLMSLPALLEIAVACAVLAAGAGGWPQTVALILWTALAIWMAARYSEARGGWTESRLALSQGLVERMAGHRTRLAQQPSAAWHIAEDAEASAYEAHSRAMDLAGAWLTGFVPPAWVAVGLATLAPAVLADVLDPGALAMAAGGIALAAQALKRLCSGAGQLAGAAIAWRQVRGLFLAAGRTVPAGLINELPPSPDSPIAASGLRFVSQGSGRAVLEHADLLIRRGDRILIEGESGGGKSTFVSLLAGLREPTSGLLLSGGLDRASLGETLWRRRVSAAPQYHENHIFAGPLAYNLLMGHNWPARPEEMRRAQEMCGALGLGPLLERMPGGLMQMVGESGWQLSQGERSRVFMARALLQSPDVVVLDESFAALDPETLRISLECALTNARTLVVVAHP